MGARRLRKEAAVTGVGVSPAFAGVIGESDETRLGAREEVEASRARARVLGITGDTGDSGDRSSSKLESLENRPSQLSPPLSPVTPVAGDTPLPSGPTPDGLGMPVRLWAALPLPSSLEVATRLGERAWFTGSRSRASSARAAGEAVFVPTEYEALVLAVLEQRATPDDVVRFVRRKLERPTWMLDPVEALAGAMGLVTQVGDPKRVVAWRARVELLGHITWERALELLGVRCVRVVVEDAPPDVDVVAAAAAEAL